MDVEKRIQRELNALDPDLFLDKQISPLGYVFYCVKYRIGSGQEPLTAVEWRDAQGPYPLSMAIVDRVKAQEGDIRDAITQATVNNAAKRELALQERKEMAQENIEWMQKSGKRLGIYGPWAPKHNV